MNVRNTLLTACLMVIASGVGSLLLYPSSEVSAANWSDESKQIELSYKVALAQSPNASCRYNYQTFMINGESQPKNVCMTGSSQGIVIGYYTDQSHSYYVAGSLSDGQLYHFSGCERVDSCLYVPSRDVLFIKYGSNYLYSNSAVMYRNVSERLQKVYDVQFNTWYYKLTGAADYQFQGDDGTMWWLNAWATSTNERWMVLELRERGFAVVDLQTMKIKRVSNKLLDYGHGMDPSPNLAISNDGETVAIAGSNAGESLLLNLDECGDYPTNEELSRNTYLRVTCRERQLPTYAVNTNYYEMYAPWFDDSGSQLSAYVVTRSGDFYQEAFRAPGYESTEIMYLAMGDSFSSGEGELSDGYYQMNTNTDYEKCHTSSRSYPYLVGEMLDLGDMAVKNIACSGARINDMVGSDIDYWGQGDRLVNSEQNLDLGQRLSQQQAALLLFVPGRIHQEKFVDWYHPQLITIGVGGNDAGLMGKLKTCLMPGACEWASSREKIAQTAVEIQALKSRLVAMYHKIAQSSPSSKVYGVGYPQIVSNEEECGVLGVFLDQSERTFMRKSVEMMNYVIQTASQEAGIRYVDVADVLAGHEVCEDSKAVNTLRLGDDVALSSDLSWLKLLGNESFHPTPFGHELLSNRIYDQLTADATNTPAHYDADYWLSQVQNLARVQNADMLKDSIIENGEGTTIDLPLGAFQPGTDVTISLHSDPILLATQIAATNGSVHSAVEIPEDTDPGFHTVHVTGLSFSGTEIDFYQELLLLSADTVEDTDVPETPPFPDSNELPAAQDESDSSSDSTTASESSSKAALNDDLGIVVGVHEKDTTVPAFSKSVLAATDTQMKPSKSSDVPYGYIWLTVGVLAVTALMICLVMVKILGR